MKIVFLFKKKQKEPKIKEFLSREVYTQTPTMPIQE
jgi:hypothetical protein